MTILEINAHSLTVNVSSLHFVSKLSEKTLLFSLFLALRPLNASIVIFLCKKSPMIKVSADDERILSSHVQTP